jgi:hypothetical protein
MNAATGTATMAGGAAFWNQFPPALLAAAIAAAIAVLLHLLKTRGEERARARILYAAAYQWYAAYKEMPYAIRRRRVDDPAAERIRLAETTREIQAKLDHFKTWTALENPDVGNAYADLLRELRRVAGASMHDAWNEPGTDTDAAMNMAPGRVDLAALAKHEEAYLAAVRDALHPLARWRRRRAHRAAPTARGAPPADSGPLGERPDDGKREDLSPER